MSLAMIIMLLEYGTKGAAAVADIIAAIREAMGSNTVEGDNAILDEDAVQLIAAIVKAKSDAGLPPAEG